MKNLYDPHPFMIDSGTFWRCDHGSTGYYACHRCGLRHPIKFLRHLLVSPLLKKVEKRMK